MRSHRPRSGCRPLGQESALVAERVEVWEPVGLWAPAAACGWGMVCGLGTPLTWMLAQSVAVWSAI